MRIDQIGNTFASCRLNSLPDLKYLGLIAIKSRTAVAIRDPTGSSHVHWKNIGIFLTGAWAKTFAVIIAKIAKHIASLFISFSHTVAYFSRDRRQAFFTVSYVKGPDSDSQDGQVWHFRRVGCVGIID